jgi:hypothetical protein
MRDHFIELVKKIKGHNAEKTARIAWEDVIAWYKKHYGFREGNEHAPYTVASIAYVLVTYVDSLNVISMKDMVLEKLNPNRGWQSRFCDLDAKIVDDYHYRLIAECCSILMLTVPTSHWPNYDEVYNN